MKDRTGVRPRRAAAALVLALAIMVLSIPSCLRAVYASADFGPCSLTVNIGVSLPEEEKKDIYEADVVVDLYRIADAVQVSGTIGWEVLEPFLSEGIVISPSIDTEGWKSVAEQAASVALGALPEGTIGPEGVAAAPSPRGQFADGQAFYNNPANSRIGDLKAGLYLVIPHGAGIENYVAAKADEAGGVSRYTVAESDRFVYSFYPELISLPAKPAADGTYSTGEWVTDAAVDLTLKFGREERTGSLEIVKDLLTYAERDKSGRVITDPATFVFEVSVYGSRQAYETAGDGAPRIRHDFVSIVFDGNGDYGIIGEAADAHAFSEYGKKKVVITGLPIGSYAVVEEVYTGLYTNIGGTVKEKEIVINDDDNTVSVEFENDYNDEHGGGGSVTNRFTYSSSDSKWGWEQITDDSVDGEVIQSTQ